MWLHLSLLQLKSSWQVCRHFPLLLQLKHHPTHLTTLFLIYDPVPAWRSEGKWGEAKTRNILQINLTSPCSLLWFPSAWNIRIFLLCSKFIARVLRLELRWCHSNALLTVAAETRQLFMQWTGMPRIATAFQQLCLGSNLRKHSSVQTANWCCQPACVPGSQSAAAFAASLCLQQTTPISPSSTAPLWPASAFTPASSTGKASFWHLVLILLSSHKSELVLNFQFLSSHTLQVLTELGLHDAVHMGWTCKLDKSFLTCASSATSSCWERLCREWFVSVPFLTSAFLRFSFLSFLVGLTSPLVLSGAFFFSWKK